MRSFLGQFQNEISLAAKARSAGKGSGNLANRTSRDIFTEGKTCPSFPHPQKKETSMNAGADPQTVYWQVKLEKVKASLEGNGFAVSIHGSLEDAARHVAETLLPPEKPCTVGFGGSRTILDAGVLDRIQGLPGVELMDTRDPCLSPEEVTELRRHMLLSDLYLASSNALTMDGVLVNRDRTGNRVGALHFGPRKVVLMVGRNKICESVKEAVTRVKAVAAPLNTIRLRTGTPCVKTGVCMDCKSPDRICSVWTFTEKSFPKGRIHIQLINAEAGF
jgi:hypothetical protein